MKKETKTLITEIMNEDANDGLYGVEMTSKEKAKYLIHKFYLSLPNNGSQTGINNVHDRWNESKNCALIAVNEILFFIDKQMQGWLDADLVYYWKQVKQEIEKV